MKSDSHEVVVSSVRQVVSTQMPTKWGVFQALGFERTISNGTLHTQTALALVLGNLTDVPLLRIHSQCFTGEVLGSLRCDCKDQLELAMEAIAREGRGLVIYEYEEGRGIGLMAKLKAYSLQDVGLDTVEANHALGFKADCRDFSLPAAILQNLGINRVRLLTNNPHKSRALSDAGILVLAEIPCEAAPTQHSLAYLQTKKDKMGHTLTRVPSGSSRRDEAQISNRMPANEKLGASLATRQQTILPLPRRGGEGRGEGKFGALQDGRVHGERETGEQFSPTKNPGALSDDQFDFASIEVALRELKAGRMIVVVDDEDRENEGDLTMAAEMITPEAINFMATHGRGLICLAMTGERLDELELPAMVPDNTSLGGTAFTVSIDLVGPGVSTGISAHDRARTIKAAIDSSSDPEDFGRPGHIFPLRARAGGVLERRGQTEAAVDLASLAGLYSAGVICEIVNDDGTMARVPDLIRFCKKHGLVMITVSELARYRFDLDDEGALVGSLACI